MPKSLKWILAAIAVFLLTNFFFRITWVKLIDPPSSSGYSMPILFFRGLLLDLKFVCVAALVFWLVGHIPGLHYFKTRTGKRAGLWVMTFFYLILLCCLALDFASLNQHGRHLNTEILGDWLSGQGDYSGKERKLPLLPVLIAIGLGTWLYYLLFKWLHKIIQKGHVRGKSNGRFFMQTAFVTLCVVMLFINSMMNLVPNEEKKRSVVVNNVWQNFFLVEKELAP